MDNISNDRLDQQTEIEPTENSFENLYARYHLDIWRYCLRRLRIPEQAEEVFNSTFTVAWQNRENIPSGDDARPWLYAVARNHIRNDWRKYDRYERLKLRLQGHRVPATPSDPSELASIHVENVHQALNQLRAKDQELLKLAVWENLSHHEIGQVLGCSENAVATRLHRARNRLGKKLVSLSTKRIPKDPPTERHVTGQGAINARKGAS